MFYRSLEHLCIKEAVMRGGMWFLGKSFKGLKLSFIGVARSEYVKAVRHCVKWPVLRTMKPVELEDRACASS